MYIFDSIGVNVVYDCLRWLNEVVGPDMLEVLAVFVALLDRSCTCSTLSCHM